MKGFSLTICLLLISPSFSSAKEQKNDFFIVDSWITGFFSGLFKAKKNRFKNAWKNANKQAKNDALIWKGLFVSDTNQSNKKRTGEVLSRWTYQIPQTAVGFFTAQFYNTFLCKVDAVSHPFGSTLVTMNVPWAGVSLGSYILTKSSAKPDPNNKLFQHEYGHYLQSKRMGFAYFVRVGIPALMSKGIHDFHKVEVDCNREAFSYFNHHIPDFQNDSSLTDSKGWNFDYNPFPDTLGIQIVEYKDTLTYLSYSLHQHQNELNALKVKAKGIDYFSWILFPAPAIVGMCHARKYNKEQLEYEEKRGFNKRIIMLSPLNNMPNTQTSP